MNGKKTKLPQKNFILHRLAQAGLAALLSTASVTTQAMRIKKPPVKQPEDTCYAEYVADVKTGEVFHSKNIDAPVLPASVAKMVLGLVLTDAVQSSKTNWETPIDIPKPPPFNPKNPKASSIHATLCTASEVWKNGTLKMPLHEAFANTNAVSNLYTTIGIQKFLETLTGRAYPEMAQEKLQALGAEKTVIIEPTGISNAAKCLDERRSAAQYAVALDSQTPDQRAATKQNISTAREMGLWARAMAAIPEMVASLRQRVVKFMNTSMASTNPVFRVTPTSPFPKKKAGKQPNKTPPSLNSIDFVAKTGFTVTAGASINGVLNPENERPLIVTLAGCPAGGIRERRLFALLDQFKNKTGSPRLLPPAQANMDFSPKIADSQIGNSAIPLDVGPLPE